MPIVYLGNTSPLGSFVEGDTTAVTTVHANEPNRLANVAAIKSLWPNHSDAPPAWVESEDTRLAEDIADLFSDETHTCDIGKPKVWEG